MRHWNRRISAAALALALLSGQGAMASEALGHELHTGTTVLSEGTAVTRGYFWSDTYNDLRTERYVTYLPNSDVNPTVAYGDTVLSRATLSAMARKLETAGHRVVGGTNGDFYVLSTGQPLGLVVTDGILRSSSSYHYAVGFRADGTAFVGQPNLRVSALLGGERVTVFGGVNKVRQIQSAEGGGLTLLTRDFGATTQNTASGVDVFLRPVPEGVGQTIPAEESGLGQGLVKSDQPRIGGRLTCVVEAVVEGEGANAIPEGGFVLTMNGQDDSWTLDLLRSLQPGDEVSIDITSEDTRWNEATQALGAMYRLLDNGQVGSNLSAEQTARTAIGVKADGTVIFYTIDGKQKGVSVGASCAQVAMRLRELGCVEAVGLDGGGSTTIGVTTPGQDAMEVINSPSDGSQRSNSTAIFLTTQLPVTGVGAYLQVEPGDALLLAGATLPLKAYQVDTGYRLMGEAASASYQVTAGGGTVSGSVYTAGQDSGTAQVTASQGGLTGSASITTVRTPDQIVVKDEKTGSTVKTLSLSPGESVSLRAESIWRGLALQSQDTNYTWSCDSGVGSITPDGLFTADGKAAGGNLSVTAGERTVTIPVGVAGHILPLEDFEGKTLPFTGEISAQTELEKNLNYVRFGRQSMQVSYDLPAAGTSSLAGKLPITAGERFLSLWVYGDGSGNDLAATVETGEGEIPLALTRLDFTGWRQVLSPLPTGAKALTGLQVIRGTENVPMAGEDWTERQTGTIWLDQLTSSNERVEDLTPPTVQLQVTGRQLTATVRDNVDQSFPAKAVSFQYDGKPLSGSWNEASGTLAATLPEPGTAGHRITVTAIDASGNVGRSSWDLAGQNGVEFADMQGHWAARYAGYLREQGISYGVSDGSVLLYSPNSNITRAEFFTMVARWMGLELSQYNSVNLPFADTKEIPDWALPAVKAMYAEGIVQGNFNGSGLYAYPMAEISRAEVMTILGRTQSKGYPEVELDGFTDRNQVPSWAAGYIRSMVGQGIIGGYEDNTLRPSASMTRGEVAKVLYTMR